MSGGETTTIFAGSQSRRQIDSYAVFVIIVVKCHPTRDAHVVRKGMVTHHALYSQFFTPARVEAWTPMQAVRIGLGMTSAVMKSGVG